MRDYSTSRIIGLSVALAINCGCGSNAPLQVTENTIPADDPNEAENMAIEKLGKTFRVTETRDYSIPNKPVVKLQLTTLIGALGDKTTYDDQLAPIAVFKQLRDVAITSSRITGAGFKHLSGLKELQSLNVSSSWVDDAGLKAMPVLQKLESVKFGATRVTDEGLKELSKLPNLKKLQTTEITLRGLKSLQNFPSLVWLETGSAEFHDEELYAISKITKLEHLSFWAHEGTTLKGLSKIAGLKKLRSLRLGLRSLEVNALVALRDAPELKDFEMQGSALNDGIAAEVARWGGLKRLKLFESESTNLTDEGLQRISKMTDLESLDLYSLRGITDQGMEYVGRMTKLEHLDLWNSSVGKDGVAQLRTLVNLRSLNLNVTSETGKSITRLDSISGLTKLEKLVLFGLPLTDSSVDVLASYKKLKELDLRDTMLTDAGLERLRKALPQTKIQR